MLTSIHTSLVKPTLAPGQMLDGVILHRLFRQMCERLNNMDNGKLNGVIILHIRKAFDSINHEILLKKMNDYFDISGMQPNWFESYI